MDFVHTFRALWFDPLDQPIHCSENLPLAIIQLARLMHPHDRIDALHGQSRQVPV